MKKISLLFLCIISITSCIQASEISEKQTAERMKISKEILNLLIFSMPDGGSITSDTLAKYTTRDILLMNLPAEYDLKQYSLEYLSNLCDCSDDMITYESRTKKFNYLDEGLNIYTHESSTRYTYNDSIKEGIKRHIKNMKLNGRKLDGKYDYMLDCIFKLHPHKFKYAPSQTIINREFDEDRAIIEEYQDLFGSPFKNYKK